MSEIGPIKVYGGASEKLLKTLSVEIGITTNEVNSLMNYLIKAGIPIASSCSGEGVCKKCVVELNQKVVLSCQLKMSDLLNNSSTINVHVAYL